jgi:hypothetical protein
MNSKPTTPDNMTDPDPVRKRRRSIPRLAFPWRGITGGLLLILSVAMLAILAVNPLTYLELVFPVYITSLGGGLYLERAHVALLYGDPVVFGSAIGAALLLLGASFLLLVRNAIRAIKGSPLSLYRKATGWRDWLLAKIAYLQAESAKWKAVFNILKSPYSLLRMAGLSPQMAISFLVAGSAVGGGVVVNETVFAERSFQRGDSGVYAASVEGQNANLDVPTSYVEGSNTLRIDLGTTPVREITIENVSVGTVFTGSAVPSGESTVVQISGNVISGGTNTRLEIGHLIFENSRCKKLTLTDIQAHTLIVRGNASDGQSLAPSPGTSRMRAIGGGHQQADAMVTNGGTYDRIWIQAPTSGVNGKIGTLKLSNLYTKGGDCVLSKMNVGTVEILLNEVGMGDGFATKEFTISTTVTGANITIEDNVEVTIAEPATN